MEAKKGDISMQESNKAKKIYPYKNRTEKRKLQTTPYSVDQPQTGQALRRRDEKKKNKEKTKERG